MAVVVSDTSPVRAFADLARFDLLQSLFEEVLVPPAVVAELESPTSRLRPISVTGVAPFSIRAPGDADDVARLSQSPDPGESEAIALARECGLTLLIDERVGRSTAVGAGIATVGLGTLLLAKHAGLVPSIRPLMQFLRDDTQFRITPEVFADMLTRAGE